MMKLRRVLLCSIAAVFALAPVLSTAPTVRAPRAPGMHVSGAQVPAIVNPSGVSFPASPDHAVTENGVSLVTRYALDLSSTTAPTVVAKSVDVGKPNPVAGNIVYSQMATVRATLPAGSYTAIAYAEGPGGRTGSVMSDPFSVVPRAAGAAGKPVWIQ